MTRDVLESKLLALTLIATVFNAGGPAKIPIGPASWDRPAIFLNIRDSRRFASIVLFTLGVMLFSRSPLIAQTQVASRWGNVSAWKGMVSVSGAGAGSFQSAGCTTEYSNNQTISLSPELKGAFPAWTGSEFANNLSLAISAETTCPHTHPCLTTITGLGGLTIDSFDIQIDAGQGTYSFLAGNLTNTVTSVCGDVMNSVYAWGPMSGPLGAAIPLEGADYPLPTSGVHLTKTIPTFTDSGTSLTVPWNITWDFSPVCKIDTAQLIPRRQNNPDWDDDNYDHSNDETIGTKGCAMTSLSMALYFAGLTTVVTPNGPEPNDPGSLNFYMQHQDTDYNGLSVAWDKTVRDVSGGALKFNAFNNKQGGWKSTVTNPQGARQDLDYVLCGANPHPVIVGVTGSDGSFPGHFVLVTGRDANDTYSIIDPIGKGTTLDDYGNKFETRGTVVPVVDPPGVSIGALDISVGNHGSLLVTDFSGNQTGFIPESEQIVQNIPNSAYFVDAMANDITSAAPRETAHSAEIFQPATGSYTVVATGFSKGLYQLSIGAFSQDGSSQPRILVTGNAQPGSTFTYTLAFNAASGSTPVLTAMPGDRNGDGKVDCADLTIVKVAFGKSIGQPGYDPRADVNGDGVINIIDLATVAQALPAATVCQ